MAVPVLAGRRLGGASAASQAVSSPGSRVLAVGHGQGWIVLLLLVAALLSRVYTTNSLAGEPTADEYLYAVHARDLARDWASGQAPSLDDLGVEGRSVAIESAALSFVLPWDPLTVGRTMQAFFNALCIPAVFVLGHGVGLSRSAAVSAALLLMAIPEFQELAWRFWTDSQATLVSLVYLSALAAFVRRPSVGSGGLSLLGLGLLLLTKESAAVTFTPFLIAAAAVSLSRRWTRAGRVYAALIGVLVLGAVVGLGVFVARGSGDLARNALLQKTYGAGPLIVSSIRDAIPRVPEYSSQLVALIGPTELGTGFVWATLLGYAWLITEMVVALVTTRPRSSPRVWGWILATLAWSLVMVTPARDVASLHQSDPWVAVAAGMLLVAVGTVELYLRNARRSGWGLALLGLVALAVLSERLVISVTPKVSSAALTFRSLMPIVPLFAILAGGGVWAAAGAVGLLIPARSARSVIALLTSAALVLVWSPMVRGRLSSQPLLGQVADRGADPDTPQGLRVEALVQSEPWLKANVRPDDLILTGIPRQLAWYADLGVQGMDNLIDLGSQPCPPRCEDERRQYILDRVGPRGVSYVIDFNVNWTDPNGEAAREWRQTYETVAGRPNLETAYLVRDKFGYPVLYVIRNHGYAVAPGH